MELIDDWQRPIEDLILQLDNTVAENKNNILTGMAAALVDTGVVRTVTMAFMVVGHTHNELDQSFSWWVADSRLARRMTQSTPRMPPTLFCFFTRKGRSKYLLYYEVIY